MAPPAGLVDEFSATVAAEGGGWFPELGSDRPTVRFHSGQVRARCFLYRFDLEGSGSTRPVVVKVRHSRPDLRRLNRYEQRPVLAPVRLLSDRETAQREYEGLRMIGDALAGHDGRRFGVLRPLAWLGEHSAIVTDMVQEPTLRTLLLGASRLRAGWRTPVGETPWSNAGAWLRLFHAAGAASALPPRDSTPKQVGDLLGRFADFLRDRIGPRPPLDELSSSGVEIARQVLPADLPVRTGHGDFVATNMFTGPEGRVTVFDPLPLWRVPVYQDLATLVIGLRVLPLQAATQGLAFPRGDLARYEAALLRGYFGTDPVPDTAVATFQLLALLDRWAALHSQRVQHGRLQPHLHEVRIRVASQHYEREARRLYDRMLELPGAKRAEAAGRD